MVKVPRIDIHTHILPETWPDLKERYGYGGFVSLHHGDGCNATMAIDGQPFREISDNCWSPERRIEDCEVSGVSLQVLSTVPVMFSYWAKPADALDLSKILNDHISEVVNQYPDRFLGLGTLPMQAPDLAARELERCKSLGLAGVEIGTHVNDWNLNAPEVFTVFQAAADMDQAVFVHPWDMMGQERMPQYWLPWLVGMPAEASLAIGSMIFGGVFERLPDLRVCFAHGGGAFPMTVGRFARGFEARPDLCAVDNDVDPRSYLGKFSVDSLVHDAGALKYLLNVMGENRVVFGSDYPFPLGEESPGHLLDSMPDLSDAVRHKISHDNAVEFLGLDPLSHAG